MEKCLHLLTLLPPLLLPREPVTGERLAFSAQGQVAGGGAGTTAGGKQDPGWVNSLLLQTRKRRPGEGRGIPEGSHQWAGLASGARTSAQGSCS